MQSISISGTTATVVIVSTGGLNTRTFTFEMAEEPGLLGSTFTIAEIRYLGDIVFT